MIAILRHIALYVALPLVGAVVAYGVAGFAAVCYWTKVLR